jgi:hypothetical protein
VSKKEVYKGDCYPKHQGDVFGKRVCVPKKQGWEEKGKNKTKEEKRMNIEINKPEYAFVLVI